jgi:hypothetical protein
LCRKLSLKLLYFRKQCGNLRLKTGSALRGRDLRKRYPWHDQNGEGERHDDLVFYLHIVM